MDGGARYEKRITFSKNTIFKWRNTAGSFTFGEMLNENLIEEIEKIVIKRVEIDYLHKS